MIRNGLRELKAMGFSDLRLAQLCGGDEAEVRAFRIARGVQPVFKRIDTCAAEFAAKTPYMYSAYEPAYGERASLRGEAQCAQESHYSRRRPQSHRARYRI